MWQRGRREDWEKEKRVVAGSGLPSLAKVQVGDAAPFGA